MYLQMSLQWTVREANNEPNTMAVDFIQTMTF